MPEEIGHLHSARKHGARNKLIERKLHRRRRVEIAFKQRLGQKAHEGDFETLGWLAGHFGEPLSEPPETDMVFEVFFQAIDPASLILTQSRIDAESQQEGTLGLVAAVPVTKYPKLSQRP